MIGPEESDILIEKPVSLSKICVCCMGTPVRALVFRRGNSSTSVALCLQCRMALRRKLGQDFANMKKAIKS